MIDDGASKKEKVRVIYDEFSASFDDVAGHPMTESIRLLLREISIPDNPVCLDVGCGTGISSFELARNIEDDGTIYAFDFSQLMIKRAEKNAESLGFPGIRFSTGDVEKLDFPDSMFDLVISNQVMPFIPHKGKALSEMYRVLKPGGQVAQRFYGGPVFQEAISVGLEVASRHPEYPSFMEAVVEFRDDLIGLEDAVDLYESAGFMDHRIFGRHVVLFLDASFWLERGVLWEMWRSDLPLGADDGIRDELLAEFRRLAGAKGSKHTSYNIIAVGKKP